MNDDLKRAEGVNEKDTSSPGREEEVIVNTQEQKNISDEPEIGNLGNKFQDDSVNEEINQAEKEKTFKEGLANNSDTQN